MRIIDYKYLNHVYHDSLAKHLKEEIKEGWQPFGTIVQLKCTNSDGFVLVQTMVKYEQFELSPGHIVSGSHAENARLLEENEKLKKHIDILRLQVKHLNNRNVSIEGENEQLREENARLTSENNSMKYQVSKDEVRMVEEIRQLQEKLKFYERPLEEGEPTYYNLMEEKKLLIEEVKSVRKALQIERSGNNELAALSKEYRNQNTELLHDIVELKTQIRMLNESTN